MNPKEIKKAAEQGDVVAQFNLGCCYETGEGVEQSKAGAAEWWKKAAEQGFVTAQLNYGICCKNGGSVPHRKNGKISYDPNYVQAEIWLMKAAVQGSERAASILKEMREEQYYMWDMEDVKSGKIRYE